MSERLDRIEGILERLAERQDRFQQELEESKVRQDRFQEQMEQSNREADERMTRIETELDENFQYIGTELGQLTRGLVELRLQVSALTQVVEQDRNQAAIDRAEFRSTVERLLEVLTERFTRNGHDNE